MGPGHENAALKISAEELAPDLRHVVYNHTEV